jgi:uncharacterized protein YjbI with pentapeptide repeats
VARATTKPPVEQTEKYEIKNRWSGEVVFTAEITCSPDTLPSLKLGLAVKAAVKARANLARANLARAYLADANLAGANLADANLAGANLAGANLARANLADANLADANLAGANLARANLARAYLADAYLADAYLADANLARANLADAYLADAYLADAYLADANLARANLADANLAGANLARANLARAYLADAYLADANLAGANLARAKNLNEEALRSFKADLFLTLDSLHAGALEAQHLIAKLKAGQIDGSTYGKGGTECACLVGTIAQPRGVAGDKLDHNSDRPAERWFMMINPGDTPGAVDEDGRPTGGGYAAQKALEWIEDWCRCHGVDPDAQPVALVGEAA